GRYVGSSLGCVGGMGVVDMIESEELNEGSEEIGEVIEEKGNEWRTVYRLIGEVRGLGAMAGIEIVEDERRGRGDKKR
uniref:aminotransferase class III-fold pyridoxal phosphate-dependent enzyme n=1 Tax=Bacillus sp. WP8 TaxID=756828 RepID=UPI0011AA5C96